MTRILCTGAGGFIGSHLMDALAKHEPVGFDNWLTGRKDNHPGVITLDITDRKSLYAHANVIGPELIIHCAASYSDPDLWHRDTDVNVNGAINVAAMARHHGARVIYFQTILPPVSSYAISKIAAEQYLRLSGVPLTVLRLANVYGPRNLSGAVPAFYKRLSEGQPCTVVDTARDMVFIDDLVDAVRYVVDDDLTGTYDVCMGHQTPIIDIYMAVERVLDVRLPMSQVPPSADDVYGTLHRERWVPGWQPLMPLEPGIANAIAYYREHGITESFTHLRLVEKAAT